MHLPGTRGAKAPALRQQSLLAQADDHGQPAERAL
jgi:hypothetical protein